MTKTKKKVLSIVLAALVGLPLLLIGAGALVFRTELATLASLEHLTDLYYTLDYKADYGLDEFLQQGASNDAELAQFVIKKLMKGLPVNIQLPNLGCSTFQAQTPDGDYLMGRNFDNKQAVYALVHTRPETGYESISMVNLSYIGSDGGDSLMGKLLALAAPYLPLDGINEAGLSIGVLQLYSEPTVQDTEKPDITTTAAIRMVLDKAATVDEAIELFSQFDMRSSANAPYHFQLADANGDTATIEYLGSEMNVYREADGNLCTTNFYLSPGEYFNGGKGQDRWQTLREGLAAAGGVVTEPEAMGLLRAVMQDKEKEDGVFSGTLWSCVYNNTRRTLQLCCNRDYDNVFTYSVDWE